MKPYSDDTAVAVRFQLRMDGEVGRLRNRYRKTRILTFVLFTLDTESPSPAPPHAHPLTTERTVCTV